MSAPDDLETLEEAIEVIEDLIGALQELHHKFSITEDLGDYGVSERFLILIERVLERYDALD